MWCVVFCVCTCGVVSLCVLCGCVVLCRVVVVVNMWLCWWCVCVSVGCENGIMFEVHISKHSLFLLKITVGCPSSTWCVVCCVGA